MNLSWVLWPVKIVPKMSYNVFSGRLCLYSLTGLIWVRLFLVYIVFCVFFAILGCREFGCPYSVAEQPVTWNDCLLVCRV